MVVEAVQNYVTLVNGLTRMTRERALTTARAVLAQAGLDDVANDAQERVAKLAEEILLASKANRELLDNLIATEVDRAASRLGFVRSDEVDELRREIADLKVAMAYESAAASAAASQQAPGPVRRAASSPATKVTPVKRTSAAKKATPSKASTPAVKTPTTRVSATSKRATTNTKAPHSKAPNSKAPDTKARDLKATSTKPPVKTTKAAPAKKVSTPRRRPPVKATGAPA